MFLAHGDRDDVVPPGSLFDAAEALGAAGVPTQWHLSADTAHGIDDGALRHAGLFLRHAFGLPFPAA